MSPVKLFKSLRPCKAIQDIEDCAGTPSILRVYLGKSFIASCSILRQLNKDKNRFKIIFEAVTHY